MYVVVSSDSDLHQRLMTVIQESHEIVLDPLQADEDDGSDYTSEHEYPEGMEEIGVLIDCLYELIPYFETIPRILYGDRYRVGDRNRPLQKVPNESAHEWEHDKDLLLETLGPENMPLVDGLAKINCARRRRLEGQRMFTVSSIQEDLRGSDWQSSSTTSSLKSELSKGTEIPPPPLKLTAEVQEFQCNICFQTVRDVKNKDDWE